jgi:hypothetical protein
VRRTTRRSLLLCTTTWPRPRFSPAHRRSRWAPARARTGGGSQASVQRRDARGGVLRRDGPGVRGGG